MSASQRTADEPQIALLLTQQERDDLEWVCRRYVVMMEKSPYEHIARHRVLCRRIIEANRSGA